MERAGTFTAVSGWGIVAAGIVAVPASVIAALVDSERQWIVTWVAAAAIAAALSGLLTLRKARALGVSVTSGPDEADPGVRSGAGRRALLTIVPLQHG